jgi:hypothetical protein
VGEGQGEGDRVCSRRPEAFFVAEHKLALALPALQPLYRAAVAIVQVTCPCYTRH